MNYKFKALGFHGTNDEDRVKRINESNNIDYEIKNARFDVFLGKGFYIWRDSIERAYIWQKSKTVFAVEVECEYENMLNFTTTSGKKELELIRIFLELNKELDNKLSFGEFLDYIKEFGVKLDLVTIADLTPKPSIIEIKKINFAIADIQICIKNSDIVKEVKKL